MAELDSEEVFRRFYEGACNDGDLAAVEELLAGDFVSHALPEDGAQSHVEAYKDGVRETREAFPDFGIVIEKVVYEGDTVAALALLGYPHGPDGDLEPTGRGARTRGITLVRVTEGRISDLWKQDDAHTVPRQLGLEPC